MIHKGNLDLYFPSFSHQPNRITKLCNRGTEYGNFRTIKESCVFLHFLSSETDMTHLNYKSNTSTCIERD